MNNDIEGKMIPNRPTALGYELGVEAARLADAAEEEMLARFPSARKRCKTCAFRAGTVPNGCESTLIDALKAVLEMSTFYCCRGKKGQKILREFVAALLALPERRLIANAIAKPETGEVCAVGALARYRGVDMSGYEDNQDGTIELAQAMGIGFMLAWQLGAENDVSCWPLQMRYRQIILDEPVIDEGRGWDSRGRPRFTIHARVPVGLAGYSPEDRWTHLYKWAAERIKWELPSCGMRDESHEVSEVA